MKFPYPGKYTFVDVEIPNLNNNCICAISILVFDEGEQVVSATELIIPKHFSPLLIFEFITFNAKMSLMPEHLNNFGKITSNTSNNLILLGRIMR